MMLAGNAMGSVLVAQLRDQIEKIEKENEALLEIVSELEYERNGLLEKNKRLEKSLREAEASVSLNLREMNPAFKL